MQCSLLAACVRARAALTHPMATDRSHRQTHSDRCHASWPSLRSLPAPPSNCGFRLRLPLAASPYSGFQDDASSDNASFLYGLAPGSPLTLFFGSPGPHSPPSSSTPSLPHIQLHGFCTPTAPDGHAAQNRNCGPAPSSQSLLTLIKLSANLHLPSLSPCSFYLSKDKPPRPRSARRRLLVSVGIRLRLIPISTTTQSTILVLTGRTIIWATAGEIAIQKPISATASTPHVAAIWFCVFRDGCQTLPA